MDAAELQRWWEDNDGEGEDEEYAHHPADVHETDHGYGVVLCLPEDDDEAYQDGDSANPDYVAAVRGSLAALFEEHPELKGRVRVALDFDDGTDGESLVQTAEFWQGDDLVQEAG